MKLAGLCVLVLVTVTACRPGKTSDVTPPEVVITQPVTGSSFEPGVALTISGTATDNVSVSQVEVFVNSELAGNAELDEQNWSYAWTPGTMETVVLQARATDTAGNESESEPVTLEAASGVITGDLRLLPPVLTAEETEARAAGFDLSQAKHASFGLPNQPGKRPAPNQVLVLLAPQSDLMLPAGASLEQFSALQQRVDVLATSHGFSNARIYAPGIGFAVLDAPGNSLRSSALAALARDERVRLVAADSWVYPLATPSDLRLPQQWSLDLLDAAVAWNTSTGRNDVVVAVIDDGVGGPTGWTATLGAHPDLLPNLVHGYDFVSGYPLPTEFEDPDYPDDEESQLRKANYLAALAVFPELELLDADPNPGWDPFPINEIGLNGDFTVSSFGSHGGHVAGIIGAAGDDARGMAGVNWDVSLVMLRALGTAGGLSSDVLAAVLYAAGVTVHDPVSGEMLSNPHPARVINMSLGGTEGDAVSNAVYTHVVENLDVLVVAAAGNALQSSAETPSFPASYPAVLSVSSVDYIASDGGQPATAFSHLFSNYGPDIDLAAPGGVCWLTAEAYNGQFLTELCAPPVSLQAPFVLSAGWQWFEADTEDPADLVRDDAPIHYFAAGTSMAAPHVAGAAALALSIDPTLSSLQLRDLLTSTARRIDDSHLGDFGDPAAQRDDYYGHGVLNLAAVTAAAETGEFTRMTQVTLVEAVRNSDERTFQVEAASDLTFTFTNLPPGDYTIRAGLDANGNREIGDAGEYYAELTEPVKLESNEAVSDGVSLTLQRLP